MISVEHVEVVPHALALGQCATISATVVFAGAGCRSPARRTASITDLGVVAEIGRLLAPVGPKVGRCGAGLLHRGVRSRLASIAARSNRDG